jgi:hypothetical protein
VLSTAYAVHKSGEYDNQQYGAATWLKIIAERSGLQFSHLVELHEDTLMRKYLITERQYSDRSGVRRANFRLSDLAIKLSEFISHYDGLAA